MSVTVSIESLPTNEWQFFCYETETTFGPYVDLAETKGAIATHSETCEMCQDYGVYPSQRYDIDEYVNMSNRNAAMIFDLIGINIAQDGESLCGSIDPETLLAATQVALVGENSFEARPTTVSVTPGSATFVDCGITAEDISERIGQLADLATEAMRLNRTITWG